MILLLLAILTAFATGATEVRTVPSDAGTVIVEYVTPHCPSFDDEPCWVVATQTGASISIETGP